MSNLITLGSRGKGVCMNHGPNGAPQPIDIFVTKGSNTVKVEGGKVLVLGTRLKTTCPVCGTAIVHKALNFVRIDGLGVAKLFPIPSIRPFGGPGSKIFRIKPQSKLVKVPIF